MSPSCPKTLSLPAASGVSEPNSLTIQHQMIGLFQGQNFVKEKRNAFRFSLKYIENTSLGVAILLILIL
jgi:hypothetical protein